MPRPEARKRKPTIPTGWTQVSSTRAPDPRVPENSAKYGKRLVLITVAIDTRRQMWERIGRDPWIPIDGPPDRDPDR